MRVEGFGFRVLGFGSWVLGFGLISVSCSGFRVYGLGLGASTSSGHFRGFRGFGRFGLEVSRGSGCRACRV